MSLLEDIFLQDEGEEARQLEQIIEGEAVDERDSDGGRDDDDDDAERRSDEAEEDTRRVDPKKPKTVRVVKNPRVVLNPARLTGPRGIKVLPDHFKDFKFRGKGHELEDLDMVMKRLEHWAHRLYPKFPFEDCLKKIESLGKKREVAVQLRKIRSGQLDIDEVVVQRDDDDDVAPPAEPDDFDALLQQQIDLARADDHEDCTSVASFGPPERLLPKATSSPSISHEQKQRMIQNRRLAEERRLARLRQKESNIAEDISRTAIPEETEETASVENPRIGERSFENNVNTRENVDIFTHSVQEKENNQDDAERLKNSNNRIDSAQEKIILSDSDSDEGTSLARHVNNHSPKIQEIVPLDDDDSANIEVTFGNRRVCRKIIDDDDENSQSEKLDGNSINSTNQNEEPISNEINEDIEMQVDNVESRDNITVENCVGSTNEKTNETKLNNPMRYMTNFEQSNDAAETSPVEMSSNNKETNDENNKENVTEMVKPTEIVVPSDISVSLEGMDAEMFEDF